MRIDERKIAAASAVFAIAGIALLLLLSETPRASSVAESLIANENELLEVSGIVANVTDGKLSLCERLCVSVRTGNLPSARLLENGERAKIVGRAHEYRGSRYIVAEKIFLED